MTLFSSDLFLFKVPGRESQNFSFSTSLTIYFPEANGAKMNQDAHGFPPGQTWRQFDMTTFSQGFWHSPNFHFNLYVEIK